MIRHIAAACRGRLAHLAELFDRAAMLVLLARVLQNFNGFLLSVLLVRNFGLAAAGTLAMATVGVVVLALLGTFGLIYTLPRIAVPLAQRTTLGFLAALASVPLSLPAIVLLGVCTGVSAQEASAIILFALGGTFFAQCNIANALQVLHGRPEQTVIQPVANLIGLGLAAAFAPSLVVFAAILAVCRLAGTLAAFLVLPRAPMRLGDAIGHAGASLRFITADAINLGADQLTVLVVSTLISRGELGLLGLCRQLLTVSDTPGWSQMQADYPALVTDPARATPAVRRKMLWLGPVCGLGVALAAVPLALWGYGVSGLALLGPLILCSVPWRYLLCVQDVWLRAVGAARRANSVSVLRCVLGLLLVPGGALAGSLVVGPAFAGGALGAVIGMMLHTAASTWITGRAAAQLGYPNHAPRPVRPAAARPVIQVLAAEALHAATAHQSCAQDGAPALSVVIPAYNVAPYIAAAVELALDQSFTDLEVIVIDDGSTDATPSVLAELQRRRADPRLRIVRQDNKGLSGARNSGIRLARGALIGFLDGDDLWRAEKAAQHVAAFAQAPGLGISFSHSEYLTDDGKPTGSLLIAGAAAPSLHAMIRRNHIGNGSTPVVRRACFELAGVFCEDLHSCEDYEMWCRILCETEYRAELVPLPLTFYRLRGASLSFNFPKFLANADRAMALLRARMPYLPARVLRAGHAEHYRIAAWKAVSTGQTRTGLRLLARAVRLRPALLLVDWRAGGTLAGALLPPQVRAWLARVVRARKQGQGAALDPPGGGGPLDPETSKLLDRFIQYGAPVEGGSTRGVVGGPW